MASSMQRSAKPGTPSVRSSSRAMVHCNKCDKPVTTTCFLTSCDCVFCEDCTYAHFQTSSNCPTCRATLSENDFTELVIAHPLNKQEQQKATLQNLFMRRAGGTSLSYADLCSGIMQQIDDHRKSTKFLLKQVLNDNSKSAHKSGNISQAYQALKDTYMTTKQELSNVRLQAERTIADLQNRLKSRDAANNQLQLSVKQLEARISSPRSHGRSSDIADIRLSGHRQEQQLPPMQQYAAQKAAKERDQHNPYSIQRILGQSRPQSEMNNNHGQPIGHLQRSLSLNNNHQTHVTPIQLGHHTLSTSTSNGSGQGPLRHLTSNSNYVFTAQSRQGGHINKRRRISGTPTSVFGGGSSQQQAASPRSSFTSSSFNASGVPQYSTGFSRPR